jgi:hypothetical protein
MLMRFAALFAFSMFSLGGWAEDGPVVLSCNDSNRKFNETTRIRSLAEDVVVRKSKNVLKVNVSGKVLIFRDESEDKPFGGSRYAFCDRRNGLILLHEHDDGGVSGKLINEATGIITPGGIDVMVSKDGRAYFASDQVDGMDGQYWTIYWMDGRKAWQGKSVAGALSEPRWLENGEFSATAHCLEDYEKSWTVKLIKRNNGKLDWSPTTKFNCKLLSVMHNGTGTSRFST